jgi:uncharacterized protein YbjT (DUF2867 family)
MLCKIDNMKIFITGGTGFVGREVLWNLHEAGHTVRLLTRRPDAESTRQLAYRHRAEIVPGSVDERDALTRGMSGCHAVIHLVGIISEFGGNTFQNAHVEATRTVVEVAEETGVKRLLHMSALGTRENAVSQYHQSKWQAENIVLKCNLDWTIFRPSVIYGREDGFVNLLAKICRFSPVAVVMGNGRNKLQPVAVEDVAHCFASALEKPESVGRTFDLCGPEEFSLNEIYDLLLRTTRRHRIKFHVPIPLANIQAAAMEFAFGLLGNPSPLTRDQLLMLREDNVGDVHPAQEAFDFKPTPFGEGIARYVK